MPTAEVAQAALLNIATGNIVPARPTMGEATGAGPSSRPVPSRLAPSDARATSVSLPVIGGSGGPMRPAFAHGTGETGALSGIMLADIEASSKNPLASERRHSINRLLATRWGASISSASHINMSIPTDN
jgi:hypothetical protein